MKKDHESKVEAGADKGRAAELHKATIDGAEVVLLNSLPTGPARAERAKVVQAETLMDDDTLDALRRYQSFFESADVDVSEALTALPHAIALRALKLRLETATAIVQRRLADTVEPIATVSSEVHRLVVAAPEHSKMRAAFGLMEKRWQETYKGGRPGKVASAETIAKADATDKTDTSPKPA